MDNALGKLRECFLLSDPRMSTGWILGENVRPWAGLFSWESPVSHENICLEVYSIYCWVRLELEANSIKWVWPDTFARVTYMLWAFSVQTKIKQFERLQGGRGLRQKHSREVFRFSTNHFYKKGHTVSTMGWACEAFHASKVFQEKYERIQTFYSGHPRETGKKCQHV